MYYAQNDRFVHKCREQPQRLTQWESNKLVKYCFAIKITPYSNNFINQQNYQMFFQKFLASLCGACEHQVLYDGLTDVIVIRDQSGNLKSTPFYVCFGTESIIQLEQQVQVEVNGGTIKHKFSLDQNGYVYPNYLDSPTLAAFGLKEGKNTIKYSLGKDVSLTGEIYLYNVLDKLVLSDYDGTLTISDVNGWINNIKKTECVHAGYTDLMKAIIDNGYHVVWLTMRSLPFYKMTKEYIKMYIQLEGPLLTEPENALQAFKKEVITHKADIVKSSMCRILKDLYPKDINPFAGGFGNKETDSIAYAINGIQTTHIFRIDPQGVVQRVSDVNRSHTYHTIKQDIEKYFPNLLNKLSVRLHVKS